MKHATKYFNFCWETMLLQRCLKMQLKPFFRRFHAHNLNRQEFSLTFALLFAATWLPQVTTAFSLIPMSGKVFRRGAANCIQNHLLFVTIRLQKQGFFFTTIDPNLDTLKSVANFFCSVHLLGKSTSSIGHKIYFSFDQDHVVICRSCDFCSHITPPSTAL